MKNALCRKEEVGKPVVFKGHTVITTELLADVYETSTDNIKVNFSRNKDKFEEGKHYILLQGEELKDFKSQVTESYLPIEVSKYASQLYLWTERGASRHCKILDTDKAWEQFDHLEEVYFKVKEQQALPQNLSPQLQLLINMELEQQKIKEQAEQATTTALEAKETAEQATKQIEAVRDTMLLDHDSWRKECTKLINKIAQDRGNDYSSAHREAYELTEQRGRANLKQRITNKQDKLRREGICKSKVDAVRAIDVIAEDARLKEIYIAAVKDMAFKYGVK